MCFLDLNQKLTKYKESKKSRERIFYLKVAERSFLIWISSMKKLLT